MKKRKIIRSYISEGSYLEFIINLIKLSEKSSSSYVCVLNVHMIIEAYKEDSFSNVVNKADIVTPDGMPIAKAFKFIYGINQDRVAGMDLMPDLMKECDKLGKKIFFYGATKKVLKGIKERVVKEYPNLKSDYFSPPFRPLSQKEEENIVNLINKKKPDFVFVALGCPKQEKWMANHIGKIKSCMIGFGGAFEVYAGEKKRAPMWMQKYYLEWLYRLLQDPGRLWRRYLLTNSLFLYLLLTQIVKRRLLKQI